MKFQELDFQPHPNFCNRDSFFYDASAIQAVVRFDNDYGASVVRFNGSKGYFQGLYEMAILKFTDEDFKLCYLEEYGNDVIGYLTKENVEELLNTIENF